MAATESAGSVTSGQLGWLDPSAAKSRYGVAYVRAVCGQAGLGFSETPPDEDGRAIDGTVDYQYASVNVQVKCTARFKIRGRSLTYEADPRWFPKWNQMWLPVYFVVVVVDLPYPPDWVHHQPGGTWHRSAAFWVRVDKMAPADSIVVPKAQRFDIHSLVHWKAEMDAIIFPTAEAGA
ncbi:DUF4365 domain-containing protein [Dactylosporangium maewongense]